MPNNAAKIAQLRNQIEEYRSLDEVPSFLIARCCKEIGSLLGEGDYEDSLFVATSFQAIGRMAEATKSYETALDALLTQNPSQIDLEKLLCKLYRARNYYEDDPCLDIVTKLKGTPFYQDYFEELALKALGARSLNHDPVEKSQEYLDVIDEIEERIAKNRTLHGLGSCFEIWALKGEYLAEKGIYWRSPALLNPHVRFD